MEQRSAIHRTTLPARPSHDTDTMRCAHVTASLLPGMAALQTLDLCANQIMRPGALAVAHALAQRAKAGATSFELLALDENAISEEGVEQLRDVLKVGDRACTA